ncbi:MAG: SRPBCC family protein [Fimbriimonas ginsengisoli]|uniref:SRPBCC family protein n=1 Tax=Fimbriimonas ginsengisoli TaxID=1005039 RepID=A0A931LX31_FIMGI|nr:SRPBCC family protein [Fimbriimonas ginsengisoli]MBI3721931.1 SRPBCC family protein [Fimbriimonas ginsengisoli]
MPEVDVSIWIAAPLERVYAIAKDSRSFPEFMKDVKSVTPVEEDGSRFVADWVGLIPQFRLKLRWRQEDLWDDAARVCRFRQLKGDYDKLEGAWTFTEENGGTRFATHLDYEYNVPTLGPLVKKVIYSIVVKNLDGINQAIKARAEAE